MFTVITGDEIVLDVHVQKDFTRAYQSIPATMTLGGAHSFNAFALANGILEEGLNGKVVVLGHISTDRTGQNFREIAARLGIDLYLTSGTDRSTMMALVQHGEFNNSFSFPNMQGNAMGATRTEHLHILEDENIILLMQGLCSTLKESGKAWLEYAHHDPSMMVIYDANIRMPAIDNVSEHQILLEGWASRASVVKVSDADIEEIYGRHTNPDVSASHYLNQGTAMVCLTRGAASVVTYTQAHRIETPVEPLNVKNTVGAGDNFIAGVTLGLAAKEIFNSAAIHAAKREDISAVVQRGIDRSTNHLRLINK